MKRFFKLNKIILLLATIILSAKIFAGGVVTFTPSLIPCGTLGCGPVTVTNATSKTIAFAGVAVSYQDPNTPLTNFLYVYTGCTNGIIPAGTACDVILNPNGFTLVPGSYPVRPLFYRTLAKGPKNLVSIIFDVQTGVECTDDSQCTSPDTCDSGACTTPAPAQVCLNNALEGTEACDNYDSFSSSCNPDCTVGADGDGFCHGSEYAYGTDCESEVIVTCSVAVDCISASNFYCSITNTCLRQKGFGEACAANNECASANCSTTCLAPP